MIAEKLQPLIGAGTVARAGQRGDVGQRLLEQRCILEAVADAILERGECRGAGAPSRSDLGVRSRAAGSDGLPAVGRLGASVEAGFPVRLRLI